MTNYATTEQTKRSYRNALRTEMRQTAQILRQARPETGANTTHTSVWCGGKSGTVIYNRVGRYVVCYAQNPHIVGSMAGILSQPDRGDKSARQALAECARKCRSASVSSLLP